tara:strand:+ start:6705 stop:7592 length:888 start_codon:yes stop_codon:yes gene_type:complete
MTQLISYDLVGVKENVHDAISSISPSATPFLTMTKSEKIHNTTFSFLEDSLRNSNGGNALLEGADATFTAVGQPTTRSNNTQIIGESFTVSATSDVVSVYGKKKQTAYNLAKVMSVLKKDYEAACVGVSQAAVAGNASTGRKMASIDQQISTSVDAGADATNPLTEAKILELGQTCYVNGSDPSVLMVKPADSTIIAGFASSSNRTRDLGSDKTLVNTIDVLQTAFGSYKVVMSREQLSTHAFLINPSMFKQCVLRPMSRTLLSKTGDSDKHQCLMEVSNRHTNFGDSGMITGLS